MTEFLLYVESGPRRKKTMVHVIGLLGCVTQGSTAEIALEATPQAIRTYLRFLNQHGETEIQPGADFKTRVAIHVMEGSWIGNGDPAKGFPPDFAILSIKDWKTYLRRLEWLQADLLKLIHDLPRKVMVTEPKSGGRSIQNILKHLAGAQGVYLRYLVGKVDGLSAALKAVENVPLEALPVALSDVWDISMARLNLLTEEERSRQVPHGEVTWTARRCLRRMLEHEWEHYMEISHRLAAD